MNIQRTIPSLPGDDYETDFLRWTERQADALRARDLAQIDWHNLIEEVESLGKSQRKELMSRVTIILIHLLKYQFSGDLRPKAGWRNTLLAQRDDLAELLEINPSLKREVESVMDRKYGMARKRALSELEVHEPDRITEYEAVMPETPPYTPEQVLDGDWLPTPTDAR